MIWGSHSADYEGFCLVGYNAGQSVESPPTFWILQGWGVSQVINDHEALFAACVMFVSCLAYSWTLYAEARVPPKRRLTFEGLHDFIFQKTELFLTVLLSRKVRGKCPFLAGGGEDTAAPQILKYVTCVVDGIGNVKPCCLRHSLHGKRVYLMHHFLPGVPWHRYVLHFKAAKSRPRDFTATNFKRRDKTFKLCSSVPQSVCRDYL
jgi:hypothetical protein